MAAHEVVKLILAEEILCECLVSFGLLIMKYSCLVNQLFMPLSHFNFLILNGSEYSNCLCGGELKSCWEEPASFLERGTCCRGCCRTLLAAAWAGDGSVSSALLGFFRTARLAASCLVSALGMNGMKTPLSPSKFDL